MNLKDNADIISFKNVHKFKKMNQHEIGLQCALHVDLSFYT